MIVKKLERKWIGASVKRNALLMDVQIKSSEEECAEDMEQGSNYAAVKVALTIHRGVECALDTEQRSNDAAVRDAQIKLKEEECA